MNVCRLLAIVTGEEQPVRPDDPEVRHRAILSSPATRHVIVLSVAAQRPTRSGPSGLSVGPDNHSAAEPQPEPKPKPQRHSAAWPQPKPTPRTQRHRAHRGSQRIGWFSQDLRAARRTCWLAVQRHREHRENRFWKRQG
jgi:pyruvate/2-oxoglutarate dehydrogenase complex dihydrolipoamide acyltransferase (E2) component